MLGEILFVVLLVGYIAGYMDGRTNTNEKRDNQLRFINRIALRR